MVGIRLLLVCLLLLLLCLVISVVSVVLGLRGIFLDEKLVVAELNRRLSKVMMEYIDKKMRDFDVKHDAFLREKEKELHKNLEEIECRLKRMVREELGK